MKKLLLSVLCLVLPLMACAQSSNLSTNSTGAITRNFSIPDGKVETIGNGGTLLGANGAVVDLHATTVTLPATGTPNGTFGNSTQATRITLGPDGRITNISNVTISGSGGGGGIGAGDDVNFTGNITFDRAATLNNGFSANGTALVVGNLIVDGSGGGGIDLYEVNYTAFAYLNPAGYISPIAATNGTFLARAANGTMVAQAYNATTVNTALGGLAVVNTATWSSNVTGLANSTVAGRNAAGAYVGFTLGGNLSLSGNVLDATGGSISPGANGTVYITNASGTTTFSSTINGNLTLTGNNAFSNDVTFSAKALFAGGNISSNTGNININSGNVNFNGTANFTGNVTAPNILSLASDGSGHYYIGGSGPIELDNGNLALLSVNGGFAVNSTIGATLIRASYDEGTTGAPVFEIQRAGGAHTGPTEMSLISNPADGNSTFTGNASYGAIFMSIGEEGPFAPGAIVVTGSPPWDRANPTVRPTTGIGTSGLDQEWADDGNLTTISGPGVSSGGYYFRPIWYSEKNFSVIVGDPYYTAYSGDPKDSKTLELTGPNELDWGGGYATLVIRGTHAYRTSGGAGHASASLTIENDARNDDRLNINVTGSDAGGFNSLYLNSTAIFVSNATNGISFYTSKTTDVRLGTNNTIALTINGTDQSANFTGNINYAGALNSVSDERLKWHVAPLGDDWAAIYNLRPVSFEWNATARHRTRDISHAPQIGFVAQEVERVAPELVGQSSDGYLGVDYAKLTTLAVAALQAEHKENVRERWVNVILLGWFLLLTLRLHHRTKHQRSKWWH